MASVPPNEDEGIGLLGPTPPEPPRAPSATAAPAERKPSPAPRVAPEKAPAKPAAAGDLVLRAADDNV